MAHNPHNNHHSFPNRPPFPSPIGRHLCPPPFPMIRPPMLLPPGALVKDAIPLPTPLVIKSGGKTWQVLFVTTSDNVVMSNGSTLESRMVALERAISRSPTYREVATIADRDEIKAPIPDDVVYVCDATGDPSVKKGGATYVYLHGGTWRKEQEDESMDTDWIAVSDDGSSYSDDLALGGLVFSPVNFNNL